MMKRNTKKNLLKYMLLSCSMCFLWAVNAQAQYCTDAANCTSDQITNFQLGTINNTSLCDGGMGYEDFTAMTTDLINAGTVNATITSGSGSGNHGIAIWIDYNDNETFEPTELVGSNPNNVQPSTTTIVSLNMTGVTIGSHRLRVKYRWNTAGADMDPCNLETVGGYQDVEDYTVNVTQAPCTPPTATFTVVPDCASSQFSVSVNITNMGDATSLDVSDGTTTYATASATGTYTAGPFATGTTQTITLIHNNTLCNLSSSPLASDCPPANDECSGAFTLNVNPDFGCASITTGNTENSTQSTEAAPSCGSDGINDDVWYKFVATSTAQRVTLQNISNSTDMAMAVYSGTCGNLTQVSCSDPETLDVSGLTVGSTYYVRVWTYTSTPTTFASFNICVGTPPPPPANDEASNAITLTVGGGCPGTLFTNELATHSTGEPVNSCYQAATEEYPSVWFKFTAPASGAVKVSTDYSGGSLNDTHLGLFQAGNVSDYSTFTIVACDDDNGTDDGGGSTKSILYATGLTSGNTYYVMVDGYSNSSGTFCVTADDLSSTMLATTASCDAGQTLYAKENYTGQSSLVDDDGNLIAIVKRNTAGAGTTNYNYSPALNIASGASREDGNGVPYLNRNFKISYSEDDPPSDFGLQLFFLDDELTSLGSSIGTLNVSRVEGDDCIGDFAGEATLLTQNSSNAAGGVSWVDVTTPGFSNFFVHEGSEPLPIIMKDFTAKNEGSFNHLNWETAKEDAGDHFELERSADSKNFSLLAKVNANERPSKYSYDDKSPFVGNNYYRLKLIGADGNSEYSKVVNAYMNADGAFRIVATPNPVKDVVNISISGTEGGTLQVTDISGKVIQNISVTKSSTDIDMSNLAAGMYFVKYANGQFSQTIKLTKQ